MTTLHDLHLDFETYCDLDLTKVGVARYVSHPSFRLMCAAWKLDAGPIVSALGREFALEGLRNLLADPNVQAHAWNAAFETAVIAALGWAVARPISCTMQRALAYGLPGRLDLAGPAAGVSLLKNAAGKRLMMKFCRPDKQGNQPVPTARELQDLCAYCRDDVGSEHAISDVIPKFGPEETALSELDAAMNRLGIGLDVVRVGALGAVAQLAEKADAARCSHLTGGAVTSPGTQTERLLTWLTARGYMGPDVSRESVTDALPAFADTHAGEVLEIRLRAAKASVKKLSRMLAISGTSQAVGLLRHQFQFCGAGRTGRWAGRGIQPQNLPRIAKGFDPDLFASLAESALNSTAAAKLDVIAPAPVLDCVSWSLRSCLMSPDVGHWLWGFDFSQIEARVLAWLAGQSDVLDVFRGGDDVYVWAAAKAGSTNRQLGKVLVLALGFGMGAVKLRETARKQYNVVLTAVEAERFKSDWRWQNSRITQFWEEIAFAARQAITMRGKTFAVGGSGIAMHCTARTLQMRLPSGRVLYYHKPSMTLDGQIVYWGTGLGGRWEEQRTYGGKLAENATQAAARDIMAEAMLRIYRRTGMIPVMTVHDEIVYSVLSTQTKYWASRLESIALEAPPWAGGLPIAGEAKLMTRYGVLAKAVP